jgi:DNA-binding response OmpR family regulator
MSSVTAVLVVDDDRDNRDLMSLILGRAGYQVLTAADVRAARRYLSTATVDAVLLDVRICGESGLDLCRELRDGPATALLPVMLVSGYGMVEEIATGYAAGADDYVVKPYRRADLLARLGVLVPAAGIDEPRPAVDAAAHTDRAGRGVLAAVAAG